MELSTFEEIENRAKDILGLTIFDLLGQVNGFFIEKNNDAEPDFKKAGIELKIVPMDKYKKGGEFRIKERTKVCSIDYNNLIDQTWKRSSAKHKLNKILFIFYSYNKTEPELSKIIGYHFYNLSQNETDELILKDDWLKVRGNVAAGDAHNLSDKITKLLAASRSGKGKGRDFVSQPFSDVSALKRAFTLKPPFTRVIWKLINGEKFDILAEKYRVTSADSIEDILLNKIHQYEGKRLIDISKKLHIKIPQGKSGAANFIRAALGYKGKLKPIKEVQQLGLILKLLPVNIANGTPWEALSFAYQPLMEIAEEASYEESDLNDKLQGLLIIPIYRPTSVRKSVNDETIGRGFIWRPNSKELLTIQKEWRIYRSIIIKGVKSQKVPNNSKRGYYIETNLPKESETEIIHIRPHALNAKDLDPSLPEDLGISKQSFWINKKKLKMLINNNKK